MKILISYFYQIRFFKPYQIPISTACWDPKWFHQSKGHDFIFKDKNGVYNGIRLEELKPGDSCSNLCKGNQNCTDSPENCLFLQKYSEQIHKLDFDKFLLKLESIGESIKISEGFIEDPELVLIVYETPFNKCSEREVLKKWFESNGYILNEWRRKI